MWGGGLGDHGESYRVAGFSVFRNVGGDGSAVTVGWMYFKRFW